MTPSPDHLVGKFREIYEALPEGEEREAYLALLASRIPAEHVAFRLELEGFRLSASSIRTYRRNERLRKKAQ